MQNLIQLQTALNVAIGNRDAEMIQDIRYKMDHFRHHNTYRIFVYGALKQGCQKHVKFGLNTQKYIGPTEVKGYKLIDLGLYPAMIEGDTNDTVIGEVYNVSDSFKEHLDQVEKGYKFTLVDRTQDVNAYVLERIPSSYMEIPVDSSGCYNYTVEMATQCLNEYSSARKV